jgi:exosortase
MHLQQRDELSITAVALAANTDFGRCRLASRVPPALWPIEGEAAISRILKSMTSLSVRKIVICCNGNKNIFQKTLNRTNAMELYFLDENMPFGTAGCIREAIKVSCDKLILAVPSQIVDLPDLSNALARHLESGAILTILSGNGTSKTNVHIYIANREIVEHIPTKGYFDIKENLIPTLVRKNKKVIHEVLPETLYSFRNHNEYLEAMNKSLSDKKTSGEDVSIAENTNISPKAKIFGPAVIMEGSSIDENAIIIGPTTIGKNVNIGKNSVIEQSNIWDDAKIRRNCKISNCVVEYNTKIPAYSNYANKAVTKDLSNQIKLDYISESGIPIGKIAAVLLLGALFVWSYFEQITDLAKIWLGNDDYSAGILVPLLAGMTIWFKRDTILPETQKNILPGFALLIVSQAIRFFGLYFMYSSLERLSIVVCLWAVIIILLGWKVFYKYSPAFLFLILMLPPPHIIHNSIMLPLQRIATTGAAYSLELFGYAVSREGNILYINSTAIEVTQACNGLRMITAFVIIDVFLALNIKQNLFQKSMLLISSLPIAVACNIARLTLTGVAFTVSWGQRWATMIHEVSGYAMVPLAIAFVLLEMKFMNNLITNTKK